MILSLKSGAFLVILAITTKGVFGKPFDATKNLRKTMKITWETVSDVNKACRNLYSSYGAKLTHEVDGCAVWKGGECKIITKKRPTEEDVGHEIRHCFQEHFH